MKKMLFLLLAFPMVSEAQLTEWDIAYKKAIPAGLGKWIHLPPRNYNPHFRFDDSVDYRQKDRVFIVKEDSVYRKLFWRYVYTKDSLKKQLKPGMTYYDTLQYRWMKAHLVDSLPVIDFSKNELVLFSACAQCFAFCNHGEGNDSCHRNVCNFKDTWFIRDKMKPELLKD